MGEDGDERHPDEAEDSDKGVQADPHRLILAQFETSDKRGWRVIKAI